MLYFLYGKDTFRLQRKLKEIESQYVNKHGSALNLEKLDVAQLSFRDFLDVWNQQSMFVKKKLFFLEGIFSNEQFKKELSQHLQELSCSENILVLIEKGQPPKSDIFFQELQKLAKCQSFEVLTGLKLRNWVKREFASYGAEIDGYALNQLVSFVGQDLWRLSNEIKKLAAYTKTVTSKEITLFVKPEIEPEIFKTIDALAQGNRKAALEMLEHHLDKGDSPFYLLSMFAYQFRNLLLVKAGQREGLHPFVLKKTLSLSTKFSLEQLKKIYHKIFQADLSIKTGKIGAQEQLRMLVMEL